jgi:hypothetical protein
VPDDFDGWVLDEEFVRGGRPEAPARTREAIARLGGQQTSWRQPGKPSGPNEPSADRRQRGRSRRRSGAKRFLKIGVVVLALAAFGTWIYTSRGNSSIHNAAGPLHGSTIAAQPSPTSTPGADDLNVVRGINPTTPIGTCFRTSSADASATHTGPIDLTSIACTRTHTYELLATEQVAGSSEYPDVAYWHGPVTRACQRAFTAYTGAAGSSAHGRSSVFFQPARIAWAQGDRTVFCVARSTQARAGSVQAPRP